MEWHLLKFLEMRTRSEDLPNFSENCDWEFFLPFELTEQLSDFAETWKEIFVLFTRS